MTEKLVISIEDIRRIRPLGKGIDQARVDPYIREAQRLDLRPVLGDALYTDFIQNFDVTGHPEYANYQKLLNGEQYTYGGYATLYDGVQNMVAYYALARFAENQPINLTSFGVVFKTNENLSEPVDARTLANFITSLRGAAFPYQQGMIQYLYTNAANFPLFNASPKGTMQNGGVKFWDPNRKSSRRSRMYPYNLE